MAKAESEYVRDASGQTIKDDQGNPVEVWKLNYGDAFATHSDATRETYKRDSTSLLHLMKYQREMMMYSPLNTPSLLYFNPLYGMAWLGSRHLHAGTRFMPTSSVELSHAYGAPTEFSAETIASPFLSRAPFGIGSRSRYMWAQRWNLMKENLKSDLYISRIFTFRLGRKGKYPGVEAYLETMDSLY